jgi:hypothetical protein
MKMAVWLALVLMVSEIGFGYRIESGDYYVSGGFGANVNVIRFHDIKKATPKAQMPLIMNLDYVLDKNLGVFTSFLPQFSSDSVGFCFRGGAKYWFNLEHVPLVPYVSISIMPTLLLPMDDRPNHFNIGLSPGVGLNFFVLAKFLVGAHVNFNPSIAFIDGEKKFEFAVMSFFDLSFRI